MDNLHSIVMHRIDDIDRLSMNKTLLLEHHKSMKLKSIFEKRRWQNPEYNVENDYDDQYTDHLDLNKTFDTIDFHPMLK